MNLYNTIDIKSDILNLGRWSFAPIYFRDLVNKGYKAHESYRVFDMGHELNVALVSKDEEYYIVIIDPYNKDNYKMKKYESSSLMPEIAYIDREEIVELKNSLELEDDTISISGNNNFKSKVEVMLLGINLKHYLIVLVLIFISGIILL